MNFRFLLLVLVLGNGGVDRMLLAIDSSLCSGEEVGCCLERHALHVNTSFILWPCQTKEDEDKVQGDNIVKYAELLLVEVF